MAEILSKGFIKASVADYNQSHYIHMPEFQAQWLDLLNRDVTVLSRIQAVPATGHPTRYWEQTKIARNAAFGDHRALGAAVTDTDYGRIENFAPIKAIESRLTFGLFDTEVMQQQGTLAFLIAKDEADFMVDLLQFQNDKMWNGAASDVSAPAADGKQKEYCGILKQITNTATVGAGIDIAAAVKTKVAELSARKFQGGFPTAIYANPISIDLLEQEEKANSNNFHQYDIELVPGVIVPRIVTNRGLLPLLPDPYIDIVDTGATLDHSFVMVNESLIERHYITSATPRMFQLGQVASLVNDRVAVMFDTVIVKGADAAHCIMKKVVTKA
jgi:hypothetical protein